MIEYDNIQAPHVLEFGQIEATDRWDANGKPGIISQYTFQLAQHPKNNYPSGGMSSRISPGEMTICYLQAWDYYPKNDVVIFKWYTLNGNGKLLRTVISNDFNEAGAEQYSSFDYSFIGHYSGEIEKPGCYACEVVTPWGSALIKFKVM